MTPPSPPPRLPALPNPCRTENGGELCNAELTPGVYCQRIIYPQVRWLRPPYTHRGRHRVEWDGPRTAPTIPTRPYGGKG
jgi:hypothetical protein